MAEFNKNMLSSLGFSFQIEKTPELNFFVQSVTVPGIQKGLTEMQTPFKRIPFTGDKVEYGDLQVEFKINEDMTNYIQLFDWITGLGFPDTYAQYKNLKERNLPMSGEGLLSDATLMVTTNAMVPSVKIVFKDLFPYALSDILMDSTSTDVEYMTATCSFRFLNYYFDTNV